VQDPGYTILLMFGRIKWTIEIKLKKKR